MQERAFLGIALALAAAAVYGLGVPLVRLGFQNGVPAVENTFFRTAFITVVFALALAVRGEAIRIPRASFLPLAGFTASTLAISICYLVSVQFIPVGLAVIIFYTYPVLVLVASPVIERERLGLFRPAVALFAFAGLFVAIAPGMGSLDPRGIALAFLASLSAALMFFTGRAVMPHMSAVSCGFVVHLAILPLTAAIAVWAGNGAIYILPGGAVAPEGYAALVGVAVVYVGGFFLHMSSLAEARASTVAPFFNAEPVVSLVAAAVLLGETLSFNQYAGGLMVLAALALTAIHGRIDLRALLRRPAKQAAGAG